MKITSPSIPVSIVIAARNRPKALHTLLASVQAQTLRPQEIIVVDDGSEPALQPCPATIHLRNDVSEGACRARNCGFRKASGKYVFIFDDDSELKSSSLIESAVRLAEQIPNLGAIGFRQLNSEHEIHYMQPSSADSLCLVSTFFGYGALISKKAFDAVGGFFEPLGYYYEENELCLKMIDRGFAVVYDPSLNVVHHEMQAGRDYRAIHRLCWRNVLYTIIARYPVFVIPTAVVGSTLRWIRLSSSFKQFYWRDLFWGFGSVIAKLPELISCRQPVGFRTLQQLRRWRAQPVAPRLNEGL